MVAGEYREATNKWDLEVAYEKEPYNAMSAYFVRDGVIEIKPNGFHVRGKKAIWVYNEIIEQSSTKLVLESAVIFFMRSKKQGQLYKRIRKYYTVSTFNLCGGHIHWRSDLDKYPDWFKEINEYNDIFKTPRNIHLWQYLSGRAEPRYYGKYVFVTGNNKLYLSANGKKWLRISPEVVPTLAEKYPHIVEEFNAKIENLYGCLVARK